MTRRHRTSSAPAATAKSRLLPRVYVSRTPHTNVIHFPPGTKFYGDPTTGSGKAHVPVPKTR